MVRVDMDSSDESDMDDDLEQPAVVKTKHHDLMMKGEGGRKGSFFKQAKKSYPMYPTHEERSNGTSTAKSSGEWDDLELFPLKKSESDDNTIIFMGLCCYVLHKLILYVLLFTFCFILCLLCNIHVLYLL